ncbi:MAG: MarR family winged helix-turn-helix transcriptional regulator [Actinomycetes bacterium]
MPSPSQLSSSEDETWRALLSAHDELLELIDADLIAGANLALGEFEVLDHLAAAPDQQIRMNELATLTRLSPSGLTRRFDALARRGWVTRTKAAQDGRGILAGITAKGLAKVKAARPLHAAAVRKHLFARLSDQQVSDLSAIMRRLIDRD